MKRILVLFALFAAAAGYAQTVEKQTFVYAVKQTDTLRLDRYVALTPDSRTKPCLMFVFGGGFVGGRRDNASFLSYFEYYARKGYVVVSIDYRLGMKKAMQAGTLSEETFPEAWITTLAMATGDLYGLRLRPCVRVGRGQNPDRGKRFERRSHYGADGRIRHLQRASAGAAEAPAGL